ncbi:MAG: transposase [Nitrospira sp.]|nr:transposase [Nitrospira sp.]
MSEIIRQFKTFSARRINEHRGTPGASVWQRNYYEHIIRDEESLNRIREYIVNNPLQWTMDREHPDIVGARCNVPLPKDEPWRI